MPDLAIANPATNNNRRNSYTDLPAYSDTGYSDTPLIVTLLAIPKSFVNENMWIE